MPLLDRTIRPSAVVLVAVLAGAQSAPAQSNALQESGPAISTLQPALQLASPPLAPPQSGTDLQASRAAATPGVVSIRSRQIELHYRVTTSSQDAQVELWYTRDRGTTWQSGGKDDDRTSPMTFIAPSEGLYGFTLVPYAGGQAARPVPGPYEAPQRWVFVDATPPLAQWNGVEPGDDFANTRLLQLRWTAHDDNLATRPVSLLYQSSADQDWRDIDKAVANTGAYDWRVPDGVGELVTVKLIVRDQGGHSVERTFGPISLDRFIVRTDTRKAPAAASQTTTRPTEVALTQITLLDPASPVAASQPAAVPRVDILKQRMAADLYRQGSWHLVRGQYAVAAERLKEALEQDPDLLEARHDLAGIFYRQQDYDRAIGEYQNVLNRNANYEAALYGAALAYVAKRDYHHSRDMLTRLLKVNDKNPEAWLDLGDVLFMTGDVANARANWRQAIKTNPSAQDVVNKAQRRLELYGPADEVSSARKTH